MLNRDTRLRVLLWTTGLVFLFAVYIIGLSTNPPGLYVDESGLAYNAYLISRTGAGEFGGKFPLFFQFFTAGYTQWCSPTQIYLLAITFLAAPPNVLTARIFSAFWVFSACVLLGFLAKRATGKTSIGLLVGGAALLTPWLFEVRGVIMEPHFIPFALALFLYITYRAQTVEKWTWHHAVAFAGSLALLTYCYSSGRMLAPLLAAGLISFVTWQRLKILITTWVLYGVTLIPILIFNWLHPGVLTARFRAATYLTPDMPWLTAGFEFTRRYLEDVNPMCLLDHGDVVVRHHVPGFYGPFFYSVFFLAIIGIAIILIRRLRQPWWRFVLYGLAIAPLPGAITYEACHAMRQLAMPVFLLITTIPAFEWFLSRPGKGNGVEDTGPFGAEIPQTSLSERLARAKPVILGVILALTAIEAVRFQYYYRREGPNRQVYFDGSYKEAFDAAVAQPKRPIYLVDGDYGPTYITGLWYAVQEGYPLSEFQHVAPGTDPPPNVIVLSSESYCKNCEIFARGGVFSVYLSGALPIGTASNQNTPVEKGTQFGPFNKPRGIAVDGKGNIYVADTGNGRIQKFSEKGELLASITSGKTGGGELREPIGVTVDASGNIYVTDNATNLLTKFSPDGEFVKEWNGPDPGFFGLRDLVAVGSQIFLLDQGHNRAVRLDTTTGDYQQWGSSGSGDGQFNELTGIAATDDRIFVADARNDRVQVFDHQGKFIRMWKVPQWQGYIWHFPDIAFDTEMHLAYVTSGWSNQILVFDENGVFVRSIETGPSVTLDNPGSLALAKGPGGKRLYVLNTASLFTETAQPSISVIELPSGGSDNKKSPRK